jgi:hypothetical protein
MPLDFDFLSPTDKPALLAISRPEMLDACRQVVTELNYKVHSVASHEDFSTRFAQIQYHLVLLDQLFCATSPAENLSLQRLQVLPMAQRRHAVVLLLGQSFQTLHPMEAFQQSVHAVVNRADLASLPQIIFKVVADTDLFLNAFRDAQLRLAQGGARA